MSQPTRKTILIVDDNEHNRDYAFQVLVEGYDCDLAEDGNQGLEKARARLYDLVLLDLSMPGKNGWDVARLLKADPATAAVPVVACTAHAMSGDRERALAVGFDGYLAKPFRAKDLQAFVEDFLGAGVPLEGGLDPWAMPAPADPSNKGGAAS